MSLPGHPVPCCCVQLTTGLSSEYVMGGAGRSPRRDGNPFAGLYASKVLQMTPEEINYYWQKARSPPDINSLLISPVQGLQ